MLFVCKVLSCSEFLDRRLLFRLVCHIVSCFWCGQNLAGLSNDASQAFLPLSGDQPRLQPGGIEDLMTYYTQTEENAARRELQQGTTYVDNLLPSAWDNIGNEVPALDVGLPDWNAHVSVVLLLHPAPMLKVTPWQFRNSLQLARLLAFHKLSCVL